MLSDLVAFMMGASGEYFSQKKTGYISIFLMTAVSISLLFLIYSVISDIDYFRKNISRAFVASFALGIFCGAVMVAGTKLRRMYEQRKTRIENEK
ncbi:MAG: hypothetical protein ACOY4D_11655 [Pseudomonadota bacterium]